MKILAYSHNCLPSVGGIATYCHTLSTVLTNSGEELTLLAPGGAVRDFVYPLAVMPTCLTHDRISLLGYIAAVRALQATLQRLQPDVLWCCNVDALYVLALAPVNVAVAVTVHGSEIVRNFGRRGLAQAIRVWLIRRALSRADRIIAVSHYSRSLIIKHLPQVVERVDVVQNGVGPIMHDTPLSPRGEGGGSTLLSVGRFVEFKGFHLFPEVLANLLQLVPNLLWILAGDGEFRERIVAEIDRYGLQKQVTMLGMVGTVALGELYRRADLLVHPAVVDGQGREESFGLVLVEAMLNGCPVATTGAGGTREIIEDGESGIIFDIRRPQEAALRLASYLAVPGRLLEIADRGRDHARRHFSHDQCGAKTRVSFQRALDHHVTVIRDGHG